MDTAHLLTLPPELLHTVIDLIPARSDLLSLALACSTLRDIIIPTVLDYRFIVAAENHSGLWRQLIDSPYCARNVRQLTVFNRIEAPRHENLFRRLPSSSSSAGQDAPSSDELTVVDGDRKQPVVDDDEGELEDLRAAFALMSQVRKLNVRASGRLTDRDVREGKDLLSVACTQLRALEEVRIAWSRMPPTPDDDNFFDFVCYPICPMHPMWQLANLKTLEFSDLWLNGSVWPSFCDMLALSPQLKTLAFPVFLPLELPSAPPMPKLPHLRRLSIPACFTNADIQEILLAFLSAHPDIHELRWSSSLLLPTPDTTFPTLPSLRAFRDTDTFFIERFLTDRAPGSVKLRTIDRIAFYFEPQRLLDALEAVQGDGVTRISVACLDSKPTLLALARMFPSLESLTLPAWCAWTKPRLVRRVGRVVWRALTTLQPARHNWRRVAIADVVPLFPALKSVRHVDVGDPVINKTRSKDAVREPPVGTEKVVEALRRKYPRLESVNGWKLR